MVLEPGVAEDHVLLPEVKDGKEHPFRVGFITEDYIYYFGDSSCFVRRAIHIEHQYGARDVLGANTLHTNKVFIYEVACSSEVQKRLDRMHLASCKGDWSGRLQEIPQLIIINEILLQPTSRRFLRELDEAPGGNNLHYILQCLCIPALVTRV